MGANSKELLENAIINRIPGGLLGFLGIKSGGLGPGRFLYDVRGVVNVLEHWELGSIQYINDVMSATPPQDALTINSFVVPAGELWHVRGFGLSGASIPVASITSIQIGAGISKDIGGGVNYFVPVTDFEVFNFSTNATTWMVRAPSDFWLLPSDSLKVRSTLISGAGAAMTHRSYAQVVKYAV